MPVSISNTFLAYVADNKSNNLLLTTAVGSGVVPPTVGVFGAPAQIMGAQSSKTAPALCNTGNFMVLAYVADNESNDLLVTTSVEGMWTPPVQVKEQSSKMAPALAVLEGGNGALILAYVANNNSNDLLVTKSINGTQVPGRPQ